MLPSLSCSLSFRLSVAYSVLLMNLWVFCASKFSRTHCKWKIWKMPIEIGRRIGLQLCSLLNTWMIGDHPEYWYEAMAKSIPLPLPSTPSPQWMLHATLSQFVHAALAADAVVRKIWKKYLICLWHKWQQQQQHNNNNNRMEYRIHLCSGISAIAGKFFIASFLILWFFEINKANRAQFGV